MSDTSLVFNLVARDRATETLGKVREKFDAAAAGIGAGVGLALGAGIVQSLNVEAANNKLAAQLGLGPAEAADVAQVSASVYENAWGDSVETVNLAIKGVYQNIGDTSQAEGGLEGVTTKALALADTFDQDLTMTTAAVGQLMRTGLADSADEAFDIITTGLGSSADKAGDFLETLNEYSTQWRRVGLDGQTATGLLAQGLQAGARDADQVADAIGQFGERALAGGTSVDAAFESIGLSSADMSKMIGQGGDQAEKALQMTMDGLRGAGSEQTKLNAAAALFGDPGNVLGEALFALDPATAAAAAGMDTAAGSTDRLVEKVGGSATSALEEFKRKALGQLADVAGGFVSFAMDNAGVFEPLAYTLAGIAGTVLLIKGGMMVWAAAQTAWAAATAIATGAQWLFNTALFASPITWIILAVVALVAVIVIIATKTTWFQTIWSAVWGAITTAFDATISWLSDAFGWFGTLPGKFAGWFGSAKDWAINKMLALVQWQIGLPGRLLKALSSLAGSLRNTASRAFQSLKDAAVSRALSLVGWMSGLPGRIARAVGSLGSLLYGKGQNIVTGLWNGIKSMGSWLRSTLIGWAKDMIPGPIAKALGIGSPSKVMARVIGRWLPPGIAMGAEDNRGVLDKTMRGLVDPELATPVRPLTTGMAPLLGAQAGGGMVTVRFDMAGADGEFKKLLRKMVRVDGRGSIQILTG
ncbi:phage tail tape measure protein [Streptomyces sp. SID12501]|uniref:Phage tail tape measure protein domain-containing protein n=1 Tax=Streptomyces sp. SID12501 TaxID=2706042 RepID=A0A6B3C1F4_9ACTN|nr:phage tail tape measure protein [Streptomyces sp. SID12501]NEC90478.1 hypothetical protein [Streptomyces sp. SID12501]